MVAGSFTREKASSALTPDRLWKAGVLDGPNLLPKLLSDFIASIEILEGDGGVGTVVQFNFTEAVKEYRFAKERIEVLDNEKFIVKYAFLDGGLIGPRLKSYSYTIKLDVGSNGETVGRITVEYDTVDDTLLSAEEEEKLGASLFLEINAIEAYLAANPTAYA